MLELYRPVLFLVLGYGLVLSACFMSALGIVLTKLISKEVEKLVILFWLGVASSVCGSLGLVMFGQPSLPGYHEWLLALAIGLLGLIQQYVLIWAVQVWVPHWLLSPPVTDPSL